MLPRRPHSNGPVTLPTAAPHPHRRTTPLQPPAGGAKATGGSRFSLDHLFRRMRTKSQDQEKEKVKNQAQWKPRPAPIQTTTHKPSQHNEPQATQSGRSPLANASVPTIKLCLSPGGRANVTLAVPITPTRKSKQPVVATADGAVLTFDIRDGDEEEEKESYSSRGRSSSSFSSPRTVDSNRSSFSFGSWRDSIDTTVTSSSKTMITTLVQPPTQAEDPPVLSLTLPPPHTLLPDVRLLCSPSSLPHCRWYLAQLQRTYMFEIRATKWAAYFLQLVRRAQRLRTLPPQEALSVRFAIVAFVRREAESRARLKLAQDKLFQHKMTEYRVAMQCICGTAVLKYGRKGKPHVTHLMVENGDTFKWTSVKLLSSKKLSAKKSFPLADIVAIRHGPTTDVLIKALQKGTLRLQDAKCTLSLVTAKRTFDILVKSTAEREWLFKSFSFLVALAKEHAQQVTRQVELGIMKKMETLPVWKHGRRGRPHKTRLFVNRFGELSWRGRSGDTIQLGEIVAIELGHATSVFHRSRKAGLTTARAATRCFSLVTRTRTLDIETESETQRDWYVVALRYLMDKVREKTAAMKREKAEKQLKLLQELCSASEPGVASVSGNVGISTQAALHA